MQKRVIKTNFALGDNLLKKADEVLALAKKVEKELTDSFTPVREIERVISRMSPEGASTFQEFNKKLQQLEGEYQSEKAKAATYAKELGIQMPKISWVDEVLGVLNYAQRTEEIARHDINIYSSIYKEVKSLASKIK